MFKVITKKKLPNIVNFQVPIDKFRFLLREKTNNIDIIFINNLLQQKKNR